MGLIFPRAFGIMWNPWSQGVSFLNASKAHLSRMRRKEYFNFRNHGNRELRTHGNGQEYTERDLGVCGYVFVPQRRPKDAMQG